jgi:hypothetical protein
MTEFDAFFLLFSFSFFLSSFFFALGKSQVSQGHSRFVTFSSARKTGRISSFFLCSRAEGEHFFFNLFFLAALIMQQPEQAKKIYTLVPVLDPIGVAKKKKIRAWTLVDEKGEPQWLLRDQAWTVTKMYKFDSADTLPRLVFELRGKKVFTVFNDKKAKPACTWPIDGKASEQYALAPGKMKKYITKDPDTGKEAKDFGDTMSAAVFQDKKQGETIIGRLFFHQGKAATPISERRFTEVHMYQEYDDELRQGMALQLTVGNASVIVDYIKMLEEMDSRAPKTHNPMLDVVELSDQVDWPDPVVDGIVTAGQAISVGLHVASLIIHLI